MIEPGNPPSGRATGFLLDPRPPAVRQGTQSNATRLPHRRAKAAKALASAVRDRGALHGETPRLLGMGVGAIVGIVLAAIGVIEFGLFRVLGRTNPNIARRQRFLYINAGANVVIGLLLLLIFR
jgi:hypothetical protein